MFRAIKVMDGFIFGYIFVGNWNIPKFLASMHLSSNKTLLRPAVKNL